MSPRSGDNPEGEEDMREAVLEGKQGFVVREAPEPALGEGEVRMRVRYCGICGSDLHTYIEGIPSRYGHEYSGDVVEIGPGVTKWEVGDRVAAESIPSCGACDWCARGEQNLCDEFYVSWAGTATGFATSTTVRSSQLHRLAPEVSYEEAVLAEPTAVALHAVKLSGVGVGDVVAVLGLGPIGQLVARVATLSGAAVVYATEASQTRIDLAKGAVDEVIDVSASDPVARILDLTGGRGPDVVFECAGAVSSTQQALAMARKGGTIVVAGICAHPVEMFISNVALRELTVKGAMCFCAGDYASALELIRRRKIDVMPLVTDVMPLDDINGAFEKAVRGDGCKILVRP
jgi:2-desacetyl-2-hydroxyethyl bacteriochlorophyllide A dehydrogenase